MYNFSKEAKKRISDNKIVKAYMKVLKTDSKPEIIIDQNNYLKDFKFEDLRYVPNEGFIGQTVAKRVTGNLDGINIEDREFELYIGVEMENGDFEYKKYGNFIVQKPKDNQVNDNNKFEALDYMVKLNLPWKNTITYPCTLKQLFDNFVAQTGLKTKVTSFLNQDFIVENNQFEPGTTMRQVLKAIAQVSFSWARIDEDNEIVMDFKIKDTIDEELTVDDYLSFEKQNEYGPVNTIIFRNSQVEGENFVIEDKESVAKNGKNELVIADNPFAYSQEKREQLIQAGVALYGLKYSPMKVKSKGYIYLNCNDKIRISNLKGEKFETYLFNHTIDYKGIALDNIESVALTKTETKYKFNSTMKENVKKTEFKVNKADQKIEGIIEQIGDRSNKSTSITADIDGISSKVEDIEGLTKTTEGNGEIRITDNSPEGKIVKLYVYGNNTVFDLFPGDDIFPDDNLYPSAGPSILIVKDKTGNTKEYNLGVDGVLKQKGNIFDEYILDGGKGKVIRRIDEDGNILANPIEEKANDIEIPLFEGENIITLKDFEPKMRIVYVPKNQYTDKFATKTEMNSAIEQSAQNINISVDQKLENYSTTTEMNSAIKVSADGINNEVKKKVGNDEIISKINQSAESVNISANKLNINRCDFS